MKLRNIKIYWKKLEQFHEENPNTIGGISIILTFLIAILVDYLVNGILPF